MLTLKVSALTWLLSYDAVRRSESSGESSTAMTLWPCRNEWSRSPVRAFQIAAVKSSEPVTSVEVLTQLTDDREMLRSAIENLGASNGTPYYDALERVADSVFRDPPRDEVRGRRAIVALTDGVDSASNSDFATAKVKLSRAGIACYFIQVNTEDFVEDRLMKDCRDDGQLTLSQRQIERYRRMFFPSAKAENFNSFCQMGPFERMSISRELYNLARREMNDLAKGSGGRSFVAATLTDARAAFARVAADIGTLYSLGYYPTSSRRRGSSSSPARSRRSSGSSASSVPRPAGSAGTGSSCGSR